MAKHTKTVGPLQTSVKQGRNLRRVSVMGALFLGACLSLTPAAFAQDTSQTSTKPVQPELKEPPYEPQLIRLSEILGALHYLRPLCGHAEGDEWRERMYSLLGAEVQNELRRRRLVERFNQSYRGFASVYRTCTPAAVEASRRSAGEGAIITQEVTGKYSRD